MNILMMTNTYLPFVGGVERSVETFTGEYRRIGHRVIIVAPTFENEPVDEYDVIRVPALQRFNGTDFSVQLPVPGVLSAALRDFKPDIVHSHHPFMIGDSALRIAAQFSVPLVYTFHTFYERYTHYVPGDSKALKRFVVALSSGYANLCDRVFAPSFSVASELRRRGVRSPVDVVPTGIDVEKFNSGERERFRAELGIERGCFVLGFVSRIAPEKNMEFLVSAVKSYLERNDSACFLLVGSGPSQDRVISEFVEERFRGRFFFTGTLIDKQLVDAYHAMDTFVFASRTETQGLVVMEAMAAGIPVVAVNGPGIGEVVRDFKNGRLIEEEDIEKFCAGIDWIWGLGGGRLWDVKECARKTAAQFSREECSRRALLIYKSLLPGGRSRMDHSGSAWARACRRLKAEFELLKNMTRATGAAMG
jgi:glycosyltransferase involved in cell wall biosynthesis